MYITFFTDHRNAMGEYIPDEGENPLTQQGNCGTVGRQKV